MPIAPDRPFPKMKGHVVRSKDWNDLVTEVQRLDAAKVNRVGDTIKGPLTIQDAPMVNPALPAPGTRLHVLETAAPAVLRIQSALAFGPARLEMWSDRPGSATEWRPGYIESFDTGNYTGGLSFFTNGSGITQRLAAVEAMRLLNGRVGIGVPAPLSRLDVGDRIRLRQGPSPGAGLFLFQTGPNADRAYFGMQNDNVVSVSPSAGGPLGLHVDVSNGNVSVRGFPQAAHALSVTGDAYVSGRVGIGVPAPGHKVDIGDRIRLRQGPTPGADAGLWLFQNAQNADRAFIGMQNDNLVGLYSPLGPGWALNMDVTTGNVGVRTNPPPGYALYVAGEAFVTGRWRDSKHRLEAAVGGPPISISSLSDTPVWNNLPGMSLSVPSPGAWFLIRFSMNGVEAKGVTQAVGEFRLLHNGGQIDYAMHQFHSDGWDLRGVSLGRMVYLTPGTHSLVAQWSIRSPQARIGLLGGPPEVRVSLWGCSAGDFRNLSAIEL
jgi:hypothetical protein